MKTGSAPRHCRLYAEPSLVVKPSPSAAFRISRCSRAASRSMLNDHSYGWETNGMRSWRSTAAHGVPVAAGTRAGGASSVAQTLRAATSAGKNVLPVSARQCSAAWGSSPRSTSSPTWKTRLAGSRKEAGSGRASMGEIAIVGTGQLSAGRWVAGGTCRPAVASRASRRPRRRPPRRRPPARSGCRTPRPGRPDVPPIAPCLAASTPASQAYTDEAFNPESRTCPSPYAGPCRRRGHIGVLPASPQNAAGTAGRAGTLRTCAG